MELTILADARRSPRVFDWAGAIEQPVLDAWLRQTEFVIPADLKLFWQMTGRGDFFESETIFAPFDDLFADDSVEARNRWLHTNGMADGLLAFHDGFQLSVVDVGRQTYQFVNRDTYARLAEFASFEDWYVRGIRPEFESRYLNP